MASFEFGLLALLGLLWGVPYALTKLALETIPPITLTAARVSLAAGALWAVVVMLRRKLPPDWWRFWGDLTIQAACACLIPYTLLAFGQQSVDSALTAILNSSTPLFVCLIAVLWTRHERLTAGRWSGVIIGLMGVVAVVGASALWGIGGDVMAQAAIVLATFSSAVSVIYGRRFLHFPPELVGAGMLTSAALILVPLALVFEAPWHIAPSTVSLVALSLNGLVITAFGFLLYFRLIKTLGSLATSSASYLKPAVGVLIGCVLMNEPVTWTVGFGLLAILVGITAINNSASAELSSLRVGTRVP